MFFIEKSNILLFSNAVTCYAVMPVVAMVVITCLRCVAMEGVHWVKRK